MSIRIPALSQVPKVAMAPLSANQETPATAATAFGQFLADALANVERAQTDAAMSARQLATGEIRDVAEVMIASEKATLALQLTVQVRNKVLEAYQEIMRMPV